MIIEGICTISIVISSLIMMKEFYFCKDIKYNPIQGPILSKEFWKTKEPWKERRISLICSFIMYFVLFIAIALFVGMILFPITFFLYGLITGDWPL